MLCRQCGKRPAVNHIKYADKKGGSISLCDVCFAERTRKGQLSPRGKTVSDSGGEIRESSFCPQCGMTLDEFRASGLLGCDECYRVFRKELLPAVRMAQGELCHKGKRPVATPGETYRLFCEFLKLRQRLEEAIRGGNRAETVRLQEELRELSEQRRAERAAKHEQPPHPEAGPRGGEI